MTTCAGKRRDGTACTTDAPTGSRYCYHHDPARAEERSRKASHAASVKHDSIAKEMRDLRDLIWKMTMGLIEGNLPQRAVMNMNRIIQLLQIYLRAAEIELASSKEPERGSVLPPDMLEKLQQFVADKDGEGAGTRASLSEMMPPAEQLAARGEEPLPEEVVEDWRQRLRAQIDQELRRQPS
jgi:hypothetical protein